MSVDPQLGHSCPHLVIEEPVALGSDRRSLVPRAPIGNTNLVRVIANNQFYIPPSGLFSQASLKGALSGPFVIQGCIAENGLTVDANVLTVTSSTETRTFRLPIGQRVPTDTLVRLFRSTFTDIVVDNDDGYLVFVDVAKVGPESKIAISGRAAKSIGFGGQRAARGAEIYPGWVYEKREDILPAVNRNGQVVTYARYPKFVKTIRMNPTFKMTYASNPERCLRCRGTYVENDWRFDLQGELITIENENLLYQAALKILLTRRGSNPFHTAYGSKLLDRIGAKAVGATATLIREDVVTAMQRMQTLQGQQAKYQKVTLKERLATVLSVEVLPHKSDQTIFLVDVVVSNNTGKPVQLSIVFSTPGAVALAGTNNLSLGLDTTGLTPAESKRFLE
jgi:phage baseplate assembly protein W